MTAEQLQRLIAIAQEIADAGVVIKALTFDAIHRPDGTAKITDARIDATFVSVEYRT